MENQKKRLEMLDAFPNEYFSASCRGMTLRDYYAAKAMHAIISTYNSPLTIKQQNIIHPNELPQLSYSIADAMLKEREKE